MYHPDLFSSLLNVLNLKENSINLIMESCRQILKTKSKWTKILLIEWLNININPVSFHNLHAYYRINNN